MLIVLGAEGLLGGTKLMDVNKIFCGDCVDVMKSFDDDSVDAVITDPPYGLSFMGKKWDYDVPGVEVWRECLRVLKPGGYLLSFAGTRTQHRMAVNIEDAGFEIRDMIAWVYGSGFPKSLNIGKAVDKLQGNERMVLPNPKVNQQTEAKNGIYGDYEAAITISKGLSVWEGWGTALKPALEPITVARKPLSEKTVAENVLKWGTGGLNINVCRVGLIGERCPSGSAKRVYANNKFADNKIYGENKKTSDFGRFPANLIHDGCDEVVGLFPHTKSGSMKKAYKYTNSGYSLGKPSGETMQFHDSDEGCASRFFYCAKASKAERNNGCDGLEARKLDDSRKEGDPGGDNPRNRGVNVQRNNHPTVKPLALMEYLIKLVTRENGMVLDPFIGSGTTAVACCRINRNWIGIEREKSYVDIALRRLKPFLEQRKLV